MIANTGESQQPGTGKLPKHDRPGGSEFAYPINTP